MSDETIMTARAANAPASRQAVAKKFASLCFWTICIACIACANRTSASEDIGGVRNVEKEGRRSLLIGDSDEDQVRLCIPSDLRYRFMPGGNAVSFPLEPLPDGTVRFVRIGDVLGVAHVEQVRVARLKSDSLWVRTLARMRAYPTGIEVHGFVFETAFQLGTPQIYLAVSASHPVDLIVYLRNHDGATPERRKAQLSSIASSIAAFLSAKECN